MAFRSLLFVPGNMSRMIEKALQLDADAVILDLEDSIPAGEKKQTRGQLAKWFDRPRSGMCYVRVNALETGEAIADLDAVISPLISGIILSKADTPSDIEKVDWYISHLESTRSMPAGSMDLIPLVESAKGIHHAYAIAGASPRVRRLCFGALDYSADLGVSLTLDPLEILYPRACLVNASRVAGIEPPLDTVYPDIKNLAGLEKDTQTARQMGFQGKLVIHPAQVAVVNAAFTPSEEEIDYARRVLAAFQKSEAEGRAAITLDDGKMIDYPVVKNARRVLEVFDQCTHPGAGSSKEKC